MSNKITKIVSYIITISFVISAFFGMVHFNCFDLNFYNKQHDKLTLYDKPIPEYIGISKDELSALTKFTLNYLNDPNASLDIQMKVKGINREVFTDDEKAHMVDVRNLNLAANKILIFSIVVFVITRIYYFFKKGDINQLRISYKKTLIYALLFIGLIGLAVAIDFDSFWTLFHKIFFTGNDLWLLDLRKDILIMIVPPQFFFNLVTRIIVSFIILLVIYKFILEVERRLIK